MEITVPEGYMLDPSCPAQAGAIDPTGGADPFIIGSSRSGVNGTLVSSRCEDNSWFTTFTLAPGDPLLIINNNIPLIKGRPVPPAVPAPAMDDIGRLFLAMILLYAGCLALRRRAG
jgi:hypothetical protein